MLAVRRFRSLSVSSRKHIVRYFSVVVGNHAENREKEKYLNGPQALDGPSWHPVLGDLQDRIPSNPIYRQVKGSQNELWTIYTDEYGPIFREVVWNDKVIVCTDKAEAKKMLLKDFARYRKGSKWLVSLFNSMMPNNTFTADQQLWTRHRANAEAAFDLQTMEEHFFEVRWPINQIPSLMM